MRKGYMLVSFEKGAILKDQLLEAYCKFYTNETEKFKISENQILKQIRKDSFEFVNFTLTESTLRDVFGRKTVSREFEELKVQKLNDLIHHYSQASSKKTQSSQKNELSSEPVDTNSEDQIEGNEEASQEGSGVYEINQSFILNAKQANSFSATNFYTAKHDDLCQWWGVANNLDYPRQQLEEIKAHISSSFNNTSSQSIACLVQGNGGVGKSTILRRLAIDCKENYEVRWVSEIDLDEFSITEFKRSLNDDKKYLLIIHDFSALCYSDNNKLSTFLKALSNIENLRICIGSRVLKGFKPYLLTERIVKLTSSDNQNVIEQIASANAGVTDRVERFFRNSDSYEQPLFMLLYILFQSKDTVIIQEAPLLQFREIIESSLKNIATTYQGVAQALFVIAKLYKEKKVTVEYAFFLKMCDVFNGNDEPSLMLRNIDGNSPIHNTLRNFIHIRHLQATGVNSEERQVLYFNHDLLREQGISKINIANVDLTGFDHIAKMKLLGLIENDKKHHFSTARCLHYLFLHEENLFTSDKEKYTYIKQQINFGNTELPLLNLLLKFELGTEELDDISRGMLKHNCFKPHDIWNKALDVFPEKALAILEKKSVIEDKLMMQNLMFHKSSHLPEVQEYIEQVLHGFLNADVYHPTVVCRAMAHCDNLQLVREKSDKVLHQFLDTDIHRFIMSKSFKFSVNTELKQEKALEILKRPIYREDRNWMYIYQALKAFSGGQTYPKSVIDMVDEIIGNWLDTKKVSKERRSINSSRYRHVLQLPFHGVYSWDNSTNYIIKFWNGRYQPSDRVNIYMVLSSYSVHPDRVKQVCIEILDNWEHEMEIKINNSYDDILGGHLIRALGHPHLEAKARSVAMQIKESEFFSKTSKKAKYLQKVVNLITDEGISPKLNFKPKTTFIHPNVHSKQNPYLKIHEYFS